LTTESKRWEVAPRATDEHFEKFPDSPRLIVQILYNRGITVVEEARAFLEADPSRLNQYEDQMKGIGPAVERIRQAIDNGEEVVVYGDYDADGVTSTVLLVEALSAFGVAVKPYIPDRFEEGYGLNKDAIADLASQGANLVITVDCGIRSVDEVAYGNSLGLDFIITDHHHVPRDQGGQDVVPPAVAVINPKQAACPYPFDELAGVGLAFKLVQALQDAQRAEVVDEDAGVAGQSAVSPLEANLLDLVALGTVADMAPLMKENRDLVKAGLEQINHPQRVGLRALIEQSRLKVGSITAGSIGFMLGPRLNAAGRLTHAQLAYQLLSTDNVAEAIRLSQELDRINAERQAMTQTLVDRAREKILADEEPAYLYIIADADFNSGVVGLVASRLTDEFYRPVLVAEYGPDFTKGSGRSIVEFDIICALDQCSDLLFKYGGHSAAAGFTLKTENLEAFELRLKEIAHKQLGHRDLRKRLTIDAEINLKGVTYELAHAIQQLQPFGYDNPTPRFISRDLTVRRQTVVGKEGDHLKLKLHDGKRVWDAIGFWMGRRWPPERKLDKIDAVYTLEFNFWNGQTNLQLSLKDIKLSDK